VKKALLILFAIFIASSLKAQVEDFSAINDGDTIYYRITSSVIPYTASVTFKGSTYNTYTNEYSGSVTIPDSVQYNGNYYKVTSIYIGAFLNCTGLTSLTIPNSVTEIDGSAFKNCSGLTSVIIGNSVTSIGNSAFYNCSGLTSITIPNSVILIGNAAFYNCTSLTSIIIPNSVISIENSAFDNTSWYNSKPDGVVYINNVLYAYKGTMPANTTINVQSGTKCITGFAFANYSELTSITIPNSVTEIGWHAFYSCTGLTSIIIPNSITSIAQSTFSECTGLTSITIPSTVTNIGYQAFANTPYYNNMPDGLVYINNTLYAYKGTIPANTTINVQSGVISITDFAFYNQNQLISVTLPNSIVSIGKKSFSGCSGLNSITIPKNVNSIGDLAFENCINIDTIFFNAINCSYMGNSSFTTVFNQNDIETLIIGDSVQNIPDNAFLDCDSLSSITSKAINTPLVDKYSFWCVNKNIPFYVPCNSVSNYQSALYWSEFTNYIGFKIPQLIDTSICVGETYNFNGTILDSAGVYFYVNGCDSIILTLNITPIPDVPYDLSVYNITMNYVTVSWQGDADSYDIYRNDSLIVNVTDTIYVDNFSMQQGPTYHYNIKAINNTGCESALSDTVWFAIIGIEDINIENTNIQTKLYPNPTKDKSTFEIEGLTSEADVLVYDMVGRVIQKHKVNQGTKELEIDLSTYAKGAYSIRIVNESINQTKKLIVQ
jgi:hypothetical protein